ncbi:MAG: hypothetical protein GX126_02370 [Bacteroidales bacterium]|nr:hypothetical protein [Bacteroidales bacterium]
MYKIIKAYIQEFKYSKNYTFTILLVLVLSYSSYLIFDAETISRLGEEDQIFEWLTFLFFLVSSFVFLFLFTKTKNAFFLILFFALFFAAGEEISWGQRLFSIDTPQKILEKNVQNEITIHNLDLFSTVDSSGREKTGLEKLLSMNFMFRVSTIIFGIFLPFCVYHFKPLKKLTKRIKLPIPPISLGIFFLVNWIIYRILHTTILPHGYGFQYLNTADEIMEHIASYILFMISIFFLYSGNQISTIGTDVKDSM